MRPLIGIPQCLDDAGRWKAGRTYQYGDLAYARAVVEAGGTPVHLSVACEPGDVVTRLDGLLLPGGDDFPPASDYPADVRFELAPTEQIAFDRALLAAASARRLPVLGICYGMQLLALEAGATLHYDIATDVPAAAAHQLGEDLRHEIRIEAASRLAALLGARRCSVNSRHHQAVREAGRGLQISARAPDGIIEAIESTGGAFRVGVQWHPESLDADHRRALFGGFVAACAASAD